MCIKSFTAKNIIIHDRITCGKILSTVSTSLENLFITRPSGVVSNNCIGHRKTFDNKPSCIVFAEYIKPSATIKLVRKLRRTIGRKKIVYLKYENYGDKHNTNKKKMGP